MTRVISTANQGLNSFDSTPGSLIIAHRGRSFSRYAGSLSQHQQRRQRTGNQRIGRSDAQMKLDSRSVNTASHKRDHHRRLTYLLAYLCVTERRKRGGGDDGAGFRGYFWFDWIGQKRTRCRNYRRCRFSKTTKSTQSHQNRRPDSRRIYYAVF